VGCRVVGRSRTRGGSLCYLDNHAGSRKKNKNQKKKKRGGAGGGRRLGFIWAPTEKFKKKSPPPVGAGQGQQGKKTRGPCFSSNLRARKKKCLFQFFGKQDTRPPKNRYFFRETQALSFLWRKPKNNKKTKKKKKKKKKKAKKKWA